MHLTRTKTLGTRTTAEGPDDTLEASVHVVSREPIDAQRRDTEHVVLNGAPPPLP